MAFPGEGLEVAYRNSLEDVADMLKSEHGDHYMVYNLSERTYDFAKLNHQVLHFGWPDHHAPPLKLLFTICASIDSWLKLDERNVVCIHCKVRLGRVGLTAAAAARAAPADLLAMTRCPASAARQGGKGRTGTVICAYLLYSGVCRDEKEAMQMFGQRRMAGDKVGITQPAQKRCVRLAAPMRRHPLQRTWRDAPSSSLVHRGALPRYIKYYKEIIYREIKLHSQRLQLYRINLSGVPIVDKKGAPLPWTALRAACP